MSPGAWVLVVALSALTIGPFGALALAAIWPRFGERLLRPGKHGDDTGPGTIVHRCRCNRGYDGGGPR